MLPIGRYEGTGYELAIRTLLEVRDILLNDRFSTRVANALAEINDALADPSIEPDARSIENATGYELAIRTLLEVRDILKNDLTAHRVTNALAEINDALADPSIEPDARSIEEATDY